MISSKIDESDHMSRNKLAKAELAYTGNCEILGCVFDLSISNSVFNNDYYLLTQTADLLDSSVSLFKHLVTENNQTRKITKIKPKPSQTKNNKQKIYEVQLVQIIVR